MENKFSILIVDDDHGMTETLSDILEDIGYSIEVAEDGYRAIEMVKERAYSVAMVDIKMPGINGVETFKEMKRIRPEMHVMMMTAYSVQDLVKEAIKEGAYGVFHKPLDIENVLDFIKKAERGFLILVVDNDPGTCETLKDVMEANNFRVAVAYSGEEAIEFARKNDFDLVIIDMKMPVLNGLDTYLALKEIKPDIAAVMMTGYRQETEELIEEALRKSAFTCLYKPMDMEKVVSLMKEIMIKGD